MDWWLLVIIFFGGLMVPLAMRLPVSFSLGLVGMSGLFFFWGGTAGLTLMGRTAYSAVASYDLAAVPPFVLMAEVILFTGMADRAFSSVSKLFGRARGGLAYTSTVVTTLFGAVTGFSPASCSAVGSVAIPAMLSRGYRKDLAVGVIGGGACLAILIPPSILMIIYGFLAEASISRLLIAGIVPGLLSATLFMVYIWFLARADPVGVPAGSEVIGSFKESMRAALDLLPLGALIALVIGAIFFGVTTATEGGYLGVVGALALAVIGRSLTWPNLKEALYRSARIVGMLFAVIIGAKIFSQVLTLLGLAKQIATAVAGLGLDPIGVLIVMMLVVFVLGCFLDAATILFVTIPIFVPIAKLMGFDLVWFGVLMMINMELATLTPPVGLNLFVLQAICPRDKIATTDILRGCAPFAMLHALTMILVILFPIVALWLPSAMKG